MSDGPLVIHASHMPDALSTIPGCVWCKVCCRLVDSTKRGVTSTGSAQCPGPIRLRPFEEIVPTAEKPRAEPT